jgi:hypothetical protein
VHVHVIMWDSAGKRGILLPAIVTAEHPCAFVPDDSEVLTELPDSRTYNNM